jgi:hypothetical protein
MRRPTWRPAFLLLVLPALLLLRPDASAEVPESFQNLQVLPEDISKDELKEIMNGFTEQLDVKCTYCHILDEYHKDEMEHKLAARNMIRLVETLRQGIGEYFPEDTDPAKVGCWTCHRGSAEIEPFVPGEDDEW